MNDKTNWPRPTPAEAASYATYNDESHTGCAILGFYAVMLIGLTTLGAVGMYFLFGPLGVGLVIGTVVLAVWIGGR